MTAHALTIRGLNVSIGDRHLLHDLSIDVARGERVGFIGGSGSGKTLTALSIAGLLPDTARVTGSIKLDDTELVGLSEQALAEIRGDLLGMVFQEPKTALNPMQKLGRQITEALAHHYHLDRKQRAEAALRLARAVGLSDPERIIASYPHEVSGGQRQRAAIAAAISAEPGLLLADEPTTALDVTVQQGVLNLFHELTEGGAASLVFITHDLAVLAGIADRIYVFHEGRVVEHGTTRGILDSPQHVITHRLIEAARAAELNDKKGV